MVPDLSSARYTSLSFFFFFGAGAPRQRGSPNHGLDLLSLLSIASAQLNIINMQALVLGGVLVATIGVLAL
jgi:hypothetical protein